MDCLFCKIINKEIKGDIVYENNKILAFRDINPQAPVHIIIVPKKHLASLNDITMHDNELLGEIQNVAKELSKQENLSKDGYRVVVNCGKAAGQTVSHIHYHLLGGRNFTWPPG